MRKLSWVAAVGLTILSFSSAANAFNFGELVADIVTGGAYSATKAVVDTTENVVHDVGQLKGEVEALVTRLQGLGDHLRNSISAAATGVEKIAKDRIDAVASVSGQVQRDLTRRQTSLDQELSAFKQASAKITAQTSPADAQRIRDDMKQAGQRLLDRLSKDDPALFPLIPSAGSGQRVTCDWANSFANPQATIEAVQASATSLKTLSSSVGGELSQSLNGAVQYANGELSSALSLGQSTAIAGLDAARASADFGLNELTKDIPEMALLALQPWTLAQHPLQPIKDVIAKTDRAVTNLDSQIQSASKHLQDDVLARVQSALKRSDQFHASIVETARLSENAFAAAARAMACGDAVSVAAANHAALGKPVVASAPPATPASTPPACTCTGVAAAGPGGRSPAGNSVDRVRSSFDRFAATSQSASASLQQLQSAANAKQSEGNRQLDSAFSNKTPAEIEANRMQVLKTLRGKLASYPNLLAAAEANLDREIAIRVRAGVRR